MCSFTYNIYSYAYYAYECDVLCADGFLVLDEFYEAMLDLIAKKTFPGVDALTKDESDEIFLDVRRAPRTSEPQVGVVCYALAVWQCDRDDGGQLSFKEFKLALCDDEDVDGDAETDFRVEEPTAHE